MFMIALPKILITLFIVLYYLIVFYLSRKLFLLWKNNILTSIEFLLFTVTAWVIPLIGPTIAYVVIKFKN
jgi:hypothetical protein